MAPLGALEQARRKRKAQAGVPKKPGQGERFTPSRAVGAPRSIPLSRITGRFGGRGGMGGRGAGGLMNAAAAASLFLGGVKPGGGGSFAGSFTPPPPSSGPSGPYGPGYTFPGSGYGKFTQDYTVSDPSKLSAFIPSTTFDAKARTLLNTMRGGGIQE